MKSKVLLTMAVGVLSLECGAQTVPSLINYQGRLADSNGAALATSDYQISFRIYDTNTAGNLIWGPQVFDGVLGTNGHGLKIPVVQGYFNVMLGPTDVSNRDLSIAFNATNRFVEIQVGTNTAVSPRQWIVSAPYALNSLKLAGADWSAVFGTNDPVNGKIPGTNLANGTVTSNQLAGQTIAFTNLAQPIVGVSVPVGGVAISQSSSNWFSPSPSTFTQVSNLSVTLTTSGRPVEIFFVDDPAVATNVTSNADYPPGTLAGSCFIVGEASGANIGDAALAVEILDQSRVAGLSLNLIQDGGISTATPPGAFRFIDLPQAGPHTYRCLVKNVLNNGNVQVFFVRMVAREL